jgi:hypothetical protein
MLSILLGVGEMTINVVEFLPKDDLLRLELFKNLLPNVSYSFPWKSIWRSKAPLRVAFFTLTVFLGKILTMDNLCK